ncbi:MAG: hypothetical protein WBN37_11180 [Arenicellales bacterium]
MAKDIKIRQIYSGISAAALILFSQPVMASMAEHTRFQLANNDHSIPLPDIFHGYANENVGNMWTSSDKRYFEKVASCISNQFDQYTVGGDAHIQGKPGTSEVIADLVV